MKNVSTVEMRTIDGGRWKCCACGYKSLLAIGQSIHITAAIIDGKHGLCDYKWIW